jgi:hypothetical protein
MQCVSLWETNHICQLLFTNLPFAALELFPPSQGALPRHSTGSNAISYPSRNSGTDKLRDLRRLIIARRTSANHIHPIARERADGRITITSSVIISIATTARGSHPTLMRNASFWVIFAFLFLETRAALK